MKRPLCSVCIAFVVCVFVYLLVGLMPKVELDETDGASVTLMGELYAKEHKNGNLILYLRHIEKTDASESIQEYEDDISVMCYMDGAIDIDDEPKIGAWLLVEGEVSLFDRAMNPGEFDAEEYYRTLGLYYRLYDTSVLAHSESYSTYHEGLYRLKRYFAGLYDSLLSEKAAASMKAILIRDKTGLDMQSKTLYQRTGISNIFAISGLHISFIGMLFYEILKRIRMPKIPSAVICIALITAYGDMTGMSGSAYRAVFMFGVKLLAEAIGRTYDMMTALSLAAVLLLFSQPLYMRQSGFLLSFGAIFGIALFSELTSPALDGMKNKYIKKIIEALCGSLSIFLIHFTILLTSYFEFPVYSFLLNLIIIPLMSVLLVLGLLCLLLGSVGGIFMWAARLVALLCEAMLSGFEAASTFSLKLPLAEWITGRPDNWKIAVFYAAVLLMYILFLYAKKHRQLCFPYWCRLVLIVAAVGFLGKRTISGSQIVFLDVGQGDGIWVESATGRHYLIDGGSTSESSLGQYTLLPFLKYMGNIELDAIFLTHLDEDHISGVEELLEDYENGCGVSGIKIDRIILSAAVIEDDAYLELTALCEDKGIPVMYAGTGDIIGDETMYFEVLRPDSSYTTDSRNAYSTVMRLCVNGKNTSFSALLTGDVEEDGEAEAASYLLENFSDTHIDVYKAAHHGSRYSNTWEILGIISPTLSVISCGEGNSYGHPHAEAVANMEAAGSKIAATMDCGAITVNITDDGWTASGYLGDE